MLIKSLKTYIQLSKAQKKFIKQKGIEDELTISKWVKLLEPVCRFDALSDELRKSLEGWLKTSFILCIATIFISIFFYFPGFYIIGALFLPCILLSLVRRYFARIDVNNNVREVVFPLLQMLALDGGHNKKVYLKIDFDKSLRKDKVREIIKEPTGKATFYDFEVLSARCELIDKTKFNVKVSDTIRKRNITKRSGNKTKFKTKYKLKRRIGLQMTFNKQSYMLKSNAGKKVMSLFKEDDNKISYKQTIKQSVVGRAALIDIENLLLKANLPYTYLAAKSL